MIEDKKQRDKEKEDPTGIKKKIHSMFDSISNEENKNVSSSLFRKTSFRPKKKDIFEVSKGDETTKRESSLSLKKSPQEILKDIPKLITSAVKTPSPISKSTIAAPKKMPFSFLFKKKTGEKGAIGLDIGTNLIKFAHIVDVNGKPVLINAKIKSIPNDIKSNLPKKENFVTEYVQDAFRGEMRKTPVFLGFNHPELSIELIKIPKVEDKDVHKTLIWKVREQLSIQDINTVSLDYLILGEKEESGEQLIYILVVLAPRRVISHFAEGFFKIGLDIKTVEPNSLALYALLDKAGELGADELALVLDLGASAATLNIVASRQLQFSRELPFAGDTITQSIADYCNVNFDEAQSLKEKWGSNEGPIDMHINNAAQMHMESLASEIVRTFQYFSFSVTKSTIKEMNGVILTGGMSKLRNLDKFLNERLKIPVNIFNPLKVIGVDKNRVDIKALEEDSHKFSIAISLALMDKIL